MYLIETIHISYIHYLFMFGHANLGLDYGIIDVCWYLCNTLIWFRSGDLAGGNLSTEYL